MKVGTPRVYDHIGPGCRPLRGVTVTHVPDDKLHA